MKQILGLFTLISLFSGAVQAHDFYSLGFKATLYYSNMNQDKTKVGSVTALVQTTEDSKFATLTIAGQKHPFILREFRGGEKQFWGGHDYVISMDIGANVIRSIMTSIVSGDEKAEHLEKLARDSARGLQLSANSGIYSSDDTESIYQFDVDYAPEALHLVFNFDRSADLR
jgi:hypothetical protein